MSTEESVSKSPLDKPLHLLTEDDISQLTREDCRRFLKDKGMRRPSWNKSQAIQQVIMLKALLEPTPDSDAGGDIRKKLYVPRPENPTRPKGTSGDIEISVSAEETVTVPSCQKDPDIPDLSGDLSGHIVEADNESVPLGITGIAYEPKGQMTIFYCGKVNVYDDVPADKAQALLQIASSPVHYSQDAPVQGNVPLHYLTCHLQPPSAKVCPDSSAMLFPTIQTARIPDNSRLHREESNIFREDNLAESSASRKASVQRYREKRKDRFKSKRKVGTPCVSLDIYLSHQLGNRNSNEQSSRSDTCSPPPVRPPNMHNRCS